MALSDTDQMTTASGRPPRSWRLRLIAMVVWALALAYYWVPNGLPTDPVVAISYLFLLSVAWNIEQPWRHHLRFVRDWAPILLLLLAYDVSRSYADDLSAPHITEMIYADRWLFGGELPTVWLQEQFYDPSGPRWWDSVASLIYVSHFVLSLTIAVVLWLRNRSLWAAFMRRWFALTAAGLATYFLYPAAPPWWASKFGHLSERVERFSLRGLEPLGLETAEKFIELGQDLSNHVAAMPSLHSAFALFAVAFFFPRVRRRWLPLLIAYPLLMSITLTYTGEHYVVDAFAGWAYVGMTFLLVGFAERWWRRRRAEQAVTAEAEAVLARVRQADTGTPQR